MVKQEQRDGISGVLFEFLALASNSMGSVIGILLE